MSARLIAAVCSTTLLGIACSNGGLSAASTVDAGNETDPSTPAKPQPVTPITAPPPGEWAPLIEDRWTLEPGDEGYWCRRVTVAEDVWVKGFRSLAPKGTHHSTLGRDSGGPDGTFRCGGFSTGTDLIYGSGVGTDELVLPEGLAVKISAGEQLLLNLHVFNLGDATASGLSGIEFMAVKESDVVHEIALVLAGIAGGLTVPPGASTQTGHCTLPAETTILAVGPHMHTRGVHQRVTANAPSVAPTLLVDVPYDFTEQNAVWLSNPVVVPSGTSIEVACGYQNDTGSTFRFGESTNDEMCYAGLYHYPRFQDGSTCVK